MLVVKAQSLFTDGDRVLVLMMEDITLRREAESLVSKQKEALETGIELAERNLKRTQGELRGLTGHLFTAREEERQRVGRDLHDDISQGVGLWDILWGAIQGTKAASVDLTRSE